MKIKLFIVAVIAVMLTAAACELTIPMEESGDSASYGTPNVESSDIFPDSVASKPEDASVPVPDTSDDGNTSMGVSSEAPFPPDSSDSDASEPEVSEPEASEPEASEPEASEPETSEPETSEPETSEPVQSEDPNEPIDVTTGKLFASYYNVIESGKYIMKTVESKLVGGEAMPYTTTATHDGSAVYISIEESYGATSELIVMGNSTYWLDNVSKQALRTDGVDSLSAERTLYTTGLKYLRNETYKSFDTEYTCEVYTDERGREFSFGFTSFGELRIYRYYDTAKKDIITIDISISSNASGVAISLPDDYEIIG